MGGGILSTKIEGGAMDIKQRRYKIIFPSNNYVVMNTNVNIKDLISVYASKNTSLNMINKMLN